MDCKLHPDTIWIPVKSIASWLCADCIRDGMYNEAITKEAQEQNPKEFLPRQKCDECGWITRDELAATQHANGTSHRMRELDE